MVYCSFRSANSARRCASFARRCAGKHEQEAVRSRCTELDSELSKAPRTGNQSCFDVATGSLKVLAAVLVARKGHVKVSKSRADQGKECAKAHKNAISNSLWGSGATSACVLHEV